MGSKFNIDITLFVCSIIIPYFPTTLLSLKWSYLALGDPQRLSQQIRSTGIFVDKCSTDLSEMLTMKHSIVRRLLSPFRQTVRYFHYCFDWDQFLRPSWSQEGEDLLLGRFLCMKNTGFYIDVGAHHPKRFSNTYAFYKKGWSGINIDPMPGGMRLFDKYRPRDINLEIAVAVDHKQLTYFQFNEPALNTFSRDLAISRDGYEGYKIIATQEIQAYPLRIILDKHLNSEQSIDFMSVDVEGLDLEVLKSNDWSKYKPKILLLEMLNTSLKTIDQEPAYQFVNNHGYQLYAKLHNTFVFASNLFMQDLTS